MSTREDLNAMAAHLISDLASSCHHRFGFGSMTCSAYDTAWLSMISKPPGTAEWLFPSSFSRLLHMQDQEVGGWINAGDTQTDVILNTAAGLLALSRHRRTTTEEHTSCGLDTRISAASNFLLDRLRNLDKCGLIHPLPVGFELILPTLLELLGQEEDLPFSRNHLPGLEKLFQIRDKKLSKTNLREMLESKKLTTALHSLEAFIGMVDFDRLEGQKTVGSMMASPSSTAAYMMYSSVWDEECEEYLRHVVENGSGKGNGEAPSAFPSTYFEISWVISTLLENGFNLDDVGSNDIEKLRSVLNDGWDNGEGHIGFACGIEPDADDTAKGVIAMNLLGCATSAKCLVEVYNKGSHFSTYPHERDASVTTNSNALIALCMSPEMSEHTDAIATAVRFLTQRWGQGHARIRDKWHTSSLYPTMLMVQALMRVVDLTAQGTSHDLAPDLFENILIVLIQASVFLLQSQAQNGSWEGKRETTAYAVIALKSIKHLPLVCCIDIVRIQVERAIGNGRKYLSGFLPSLNVLSPERLWVEKVTYGSSYLSQAYILAALADPEATEKPINTSNQERILNLLPGRIEDILKPAGFFEALEVFSKMPTWLLHSSLIEASLFRCRVRNRCIKTFPGVTTKKEKHLAFVPLTWTAINNLHSQPLGSDIMTEMMNISALAYQVDEFMETHVSVLSPVRLEALKATIPHLVTEAMAGVESLMLQRDISDASHIMNRQVHQCDFCVNSDGEDPSALCPHTPDRRNGHEESDCIVERTVRRFISSMCCTFHTSHATDYIKAQLEDSLVKYLVAHLSQTEANRRLAALRPVSGTNTKILRQPGYSLLSWTRTTSGDHTVGRLATWLFFSLLGSTSGRTHDPLPSPRSKYIAEDLARHLAASSRLYNDIGSMARDRVEHNLNSINFDEFHGLVAPERELLHIANYEKRCLDRVMEEIKTQMDGQDYAAISAFCATADMYSQMYVVRDMTPHNRPSEPVGSQQPTGGSAVWSEKAQ